MEQNKELLLQSGNESLRKEISQLKAKVADLENEKQILIATHKLHEDLMTPVLTPPDSPIKKVFSHQRVFEEEIEHDVGGCEECQEFLKELRKIHEAEVQKELEKLEERHNRLKADLEREKEKGRFLQDCYQRALHSIQKEQKEEKAQTSKDFGDENGQLNETGLSLQDEMEEAKALQVEEEKLTVVAFQGQNDGKLSKWLFIKFFVIFILSMVFFIIWLLCQISISIDPTDPDGLYNRRKYI